MFILLSKTFDFLLSPLSWAVLLLIAALWMRRHPRRMTGLVLAALGVTVVFGMPPVSNLLMRGVERSARSTFQANVTYDAVIVLGGSLDAVLSKEHGQLEYNNAVDRLLKGYALYKSGHARNILLAGGNTFPMEGVPPESAFHAKQLREWGVEPAHLVSEQESRNTYENAVETAKLTRARGWTKLLLITSAAHMPRAEGCFRAAGLQVDTLPVDHRGTRAWEKSILPRASSLAMSTDALRELAGRWVYRLRGFSQP